MVFPVPPLDVGSVPDVNLSVLRFGIFEVASVSPLHVPDVMVPTFQIAPLPWKLSCKLLPVPVCPVQPANE